MDVIPFEAAHAEQLLRLDVGAILAISSASVYADAQGRTLDEAEGVEDFPEFPVPIPESQATVQPGDEMYSTKKAKLERVLLENEQVPAAKRSWRGRPDAVVDAEAASGRHEQGRA